ncbi:MAG: hypothetical protein A2Z72_02225 [Omnitrophica bacterium RBG_13_46_9]|nr:MAG: hypothetical protein A2Z72_02225 [Omnitrophica bacterium RBG_13_46_9]
MSNRKFAKLSILNNRGREIFSLPLYYSIPFTYVSLHDLGKEPVQPTRLGRFFAPTLRPPILIEKLIH